MQLQGVIHRVVGNQVDLMLEDGTFIQTIASAITTPLYNEDNQQIPLKECSNQSPSDELPPNKYPHQLSMF